MEAIAQNFFGRGEAPRKEPRAAPAHDPRRVPAPKRPAAGELSPLIFSASFPQILRRFAAVAAVAKTSQQRPVRKHGPAAFVIDPVVYIRRPDPPPGPCAFLAKRLLQQLIWPEIVLPLRRAVKPVPGFGSLAAIAGAFCLVRFAVSASRQRPAAWMSARPHGLCCHGLSPP